jgi:hypothetical protein
MKRTVIPVVLIGLVVWSARWITRDGVNSRPFGSTQLLPAGAGTAAFVLIGGIVTVYLLFFWGRWRLRP